MPSLFWRSYETKARYDAFKGKPQNRGLYIEDTVESSDILTTLTDQGNTSVTIFYKFSVLLKKIIHENRHGKKWGGA